MLEICEQNKRDWENQREQTGHWEGHLFFFFGPIWTLGTKCPPWPKGASANQLGNLIYYPCVKSRSQNWDPTSCKSHLKVFRFRSWKPRVWKSRPQSWDPKSWKPYPKISQAPKLRSQVLKTMSWKPYPFCLAALPCLSDRWRKTLRKVTADDFPQWVFSGAPSQTSEPDPARHPVLDVGYPGSPFRARMS
jgi:hypothetical protein